MGNTEAAEILLELGADPFTEDAEGRSCLVKAADTHHTAIISPIVERMDKMMKDREKFEKDKSKALAFAVTKHHNAAVSVLLDLGANPERQDWDHSLHSAFHIAAVTGNGNAVERIFEKWYDAAHREYKSVFKLKTIHGRTALSIAARQGSTDVVKTLLERGATFTESRDQYTPMHWAAHNGHVQIISMLYNTNKASIDWKDFEHGRTPLFFAAKNGHVAAVEELLKLGADPTIAGNAGNTPLHVAIFSGQPEVVEVLLRLGESHLPNMINRKNKGLERTPLWLAARQRLRGRRDMVRWLLDAGADPFLLNGQIGNAMHGAAMCPGDGAIQMIAKKAGSSILESRTVFWDETPLLSAVSEGAEENIILLLDLGSDINARNRQHKTPLLLASEKPSNKIFKILLERDEDLMQRDMEGRTVAHIVARYGNKDRLQMVLAKCDSGALRARDGIEGTLLHQAALAGDIPSLKILPSKYGEMGLREVLLWRREDGLTASEAAIATGNENVWKVLNKAEKEYWKLET